MQISWVNADSTITTSQRSAKGDNQPLTTLVTAAAYTVNTPQTKLEMVNNTQVLSVSWLFAQTTAPSSSMAHMYAYSPQQPSSTDSTATIRKHSNYNQFNMDMTAALSSATSDPTAGTIASGASSSSSSSSSTASSGKKEKPAERDLSKNTTRIMLVHMIFMVVAWLGLAPLAVLLARYGRTLFSWYPHHRNIQYATVIFTVIGFFLSVAWMSLTGSTQFNKNHHQVGLVIFLLVLIQTALGLSAHRYNAKTGHRYIGYVHAPIGILLFGLAIWNMQTGFQLWDWKPTKAANYFVYGWMGLIILLYLAGFVFLPREIKQSKERNQQEKRGLQQVDSGDSHLA